MITQESPKLENILSNLNDQQYQAAMSKHSGHILVLAGAGCGKTSVLTSRAAVLLSQGVHPQELLVCTFTKKAASEMKQRLNSIVDNQKCEKLTVSTFHAYCLQVLKEKIFETTNFCKLGFKKNPILLADDEKNKVLRDITTKEQRELFGTNLSLIDSYLDKIAVSAPKKIEFPESIAQTIFDIHKKYEIFKRENGFWDFSDLIAGVVTLFTNNEELLFHYASRLKYILVDEFQDTNPLQIELLKLLISQGAKVFAVGDDDQAIYGFRGSDTKVIHNFEMLFPLSMIYKLEINYRSTPTILNCANKIFKEKPLQFRKILRSGNVATVGKGQKPQSFLAENENELVKWIHEQTVTLNCKYAIPIDKMTVLCRINQTINCLKNIYQNVILDESQIPQFLTVHSSKGLEFPVVFLVDLEESVFPSFKIRKSKNPHTWGQWLNYVLKGEFRKKVFEGDFDEERRLFYVGVTRAEKFLFLGSCKTKMIYGRKRAFEKSRFLKLIN